MVSTRRSLAAVDDHAVVKPAAGRFQGNESGSNHSPETAHEVSTSVGVRTRRPRNATKSTEQHQDTSHAQEQVTSDLGQALIVEDRNPDNGEVIDHSSGEIPSILAVSTGSPTVLSVVGAGTVSSKNDNSRRTPSTRETVGHSKEIGNGLTELIPGYVAPLRLEASCLNKYRPKGGITELRRQAERSDSSTSKFVVEATESHARVMKRSSNGFLPTTYASLYSSFKTGTKKVPDISAGSGWFGMMPTPMTDEVKTDLAVIRNRNYLDPKRFYKSSDSTKGKVLQVGTVIEGASEFYSSRLTKKQRRNNLTEEVMADPHVADYAKSKYRAMQKSKTETHRKFQKKKNPRRSRRGY